MQKQANYKAIIILYVVLISFFTFKIISSIINNNFGILSGILIFVNILAIYELVRIVRKVIKKKSEKR